MCQRDLHKKEGDEAREKQGGRASLTKIMSITGVAVYFQHSKMQQIKMLMNKIVKYMVTVEMQVKLPLPLCRGNSGLTQAIARSPERSASCVERKRERENENYSGTRRQVEMYVNSIDDVNKLPSESHCERFIIKSIDYRPIRELCVIDSRARGTLQSQPESPERRKRNEKKNR